MNPSAYKKTFWILFAVCTLTILPFLGLSDFNTKGEPREAIVSYSMTEQDNWILPRNNGGDIPYKPPFLHWCIAAASELLNDGNVNEAMSRLPSAIAFIAMTLCCFAFYSRRTTLNLGIVSAMIAFTTFELHRAGVNCRVDMMLTALIVISLLCFYRWYEKGLENIPWPAVLFMSCATLTKGPVGTIIPCLVTGIFLLFRKENVIKITGKLCLCGILSLILPLMWYIAAYAQGGQEFLDLVLEENFGRMTGTMNYESHVNPWYYNLITLFAGYVPWTLLVVVSLFSLHYHRPDLSKKAIIDIKANLKRMSPVDMFSLTAIVVIFIFYCIPASKRSVYLMPIYPFIAYFLARYSFYLIKIGAKAIKVYGGIISAVCLLLPIILIALKCGIVPDSVFSGKHAAQNIAMLHALIDINGAWSWIIIALTTIIGVAWWVYSRKKLNNNFIYAIVALTLGLYLSLDGVYQPAVLNAKSKRVLAADIDRHTPENEGKLYEFIAEGEFSTGNPTHFFEINFYLGNSIGNFYKTRPEKGFILINNYDTEIYLPEFAKEGYIFEPVYKSSQTSKIHDTLEVYKFIKKR